MVSTPCMLLIVISILQYHVVLAITRNNHARKPPSRYTHHYSKNCTDIQFSKFAQHDFFSRWRLYRLNDVFFNLTKRVYSSKVCEHWPESMACHFLLSAASPGDIDWLTQYNTQHLNHSVGHNMSKYTLVHLRLGDVMKTDSRDCWDVACIHSIGRHYLFLFPKSYYETILPLIPRDKPMLIVANPYHLVEHQIMVDRNLDYLRKVVCFFRANRFSVSYFGDGRSPDDDFTAMTTSSSLVLGGGGFSHLAGLVSAASGHRVIYNHSAINSILKREYISTYLS